MAAGVQFIARWQSVVKDRWESRPGAVCPQAIEEECRQGGSMHRGYWP